MSVRYSAFTFALPQVPEGTVRPKGYLGYFYCDLCNRFGHTGASSLCPVKEIVIEIRPVKIEVVIASKN